MRGCFSSGCGITEKANMCLMACGDARRSIMMSMIIWDWLLARLLGRPVFGAAAWQFGAQVGLEISRRQ